LAIAESIWRENPLHLMGSSVQHEPKAGRYSFALTLANKGPTPVEVAAIRLLKPVGGTLREDPPALVSSSEDPKYLRELRMGPAVKILPVEREIGPGDTASVSFVFIPTRGWKGGVLVASIEAETRGPKRRRLREKLCVPLAM
jgi:hypothetical protein